MSDSSNRDGGNSSFKDFDTVPGEPDPNAIRKSNLAQPEQIGRYVIEGTLGTGGFGRVYRGFDAILKRYVAIKVPHANRISQPDEIEQYLDEAQILARLEHPAIVPVYDVDKTEEGLCYVVTALIEGGDLAKRIKERRPSHEESAELIATVAEALHYAHGRRIVHRDIKPANILVNASGKPFITDFGLALKEEDFGVGSGTAGTPQYMSPEQACGKGNTVDGYSDAFSLGVVLYELLCGQRPFRGDTISELLEQIRSMDARPLRAIDNTIPHELETICMRALRKNRSQRYSAKEIADSLRAYLRHSASSRGIKPSPSREVRQFLDLLEKTGVVLHEEVLEAAIDWNSDTIKKILKEYEQTRGWTKYQRGEIQAGRVARLVFGSYVVRERIGEGNNAEVFKANHVGLQRVDTLKVIRADVLNSFHPLKRQQMIERFVQGAQAAAQLDHENIVRTYNFDHGQCFLAMEYIDGPDLDAFSPEAGLTERDAVDFVLQAARGLEHAHSREQPVLHRDIRPRNLMFDERTSKVKITDWGIARICEEGTVDIPGTRLTQPGEVLSTAFYFISPEQVEGSAVADHRSDIYSLGCTLFTLLTHRPVYECKTSTLALMAHGDPKYPLPSLQKEAGVSPELDAVFQKMAAKSPAERYQSAREVIVALELCQSMVDSHA